MPFKKGNTLWKEGLKAREEKEDKINSFLYIAANGGIEEYANKLDKLARAEKLEKEELLFMDKMEKLFPYLKARKVPELEPGDEGSLGVLVYLPKKDE